MMLLTIAALLPAIFWGIHQFGLRALFIMEIGIGAALLTEMLVNKLSKQPYTIKDWHAVLVGLTVALLVPAGVPWWLVFIAGSLAILLGKVVFGPIGGAPISPALVGLLIVAASWPSEIASYRVHKNADEAWHQENIAPPEAPLDAVLADPSDIEDYDLVKLFVGQQAGPIGAVSPLMLILGGLFLIWMRVIRWQAPIGFIIGLGVAAAIGHAMDPWGCPPAAFHLFTGSAMFGAFFLCTDWTSTPVTPVGMFLFGLLAGGLSLLLRLSGMPYAPVPWAIVIISLATPLLDRIKQRPFGKVVRHA
jgi:electron transport complex protein RnfD